MDKHSEMAERFYQQLLSGNRVIFVYEADGQYLGEAALVLDQNDPDLTIPNRRVYFSRMIVKPEFRGQGIGGQLIDHLVSYAKERGYKEMSVGVDIVNIGARWLYEKKGFTSIVFVGQDDIGKYVKLVKEL
jgi:GNAT superfamily N-acetyltransferase